MKHAVTTGRISYAKAIAPMPRTRTPVRHARPIFPEPRRQTDEQAAANLRILSTCHYPITAAYLSAYEHDLAIRWDTAGISNAVAAGRLNVALAATEDPDVEHPLRVAAGRLFARAFREAMLWSPEGAS